MAQMEIDMTLDQIISKVQGMTIDKTARNLARSQWYNIVTVTWEDCARYKKSVWGPCISDMTLQVGDNRMPVIRKNNYTDITWDIELDKIPIVVGNEKIKNNDKNNDIHVDDHDEKSASIDQNIENNSQVNDTMRSMESQHKVDHMDDTGAENDHDKKKNEEDNSANDKVQDNVDVDKPENKEDKKQEDKEDDGKEDNKEDNKEDDNDNEGEVGKLKTISLKQYLKNFEKYMTKVCNKKINLLKKDESKDTHAIVSSQACFLPIEKGKETTFNVALFNYESTKDNPGVLAIVATSKGTSAQVILGNGDEKLLFNDFGIKADFIGQRLTDNRIERGVKDLNAPMTKQEKQDNCILIIQVPLKQQIIQQQKQSYFDNVFVKSGVPAHSNVSAINAAYDDDIVDACLEEVEDSMDYLECCQLEPISSSRHSSSNSTTTTHISSMQHDSGSYHFLHSMRGLRTGRDHNECSPGRVWKRQLNLNRQLQQQQQQQQISNDDNGDAAEECNIEPAMVKVAPQTVPQCVCGLLLQQIGNSVNYKADDHVQVKCSECSKDKEIETVSWMCPNENKHYMHRNGYYLCDKCCHKKLSFDELKGTSVDKLVRDEKYPIRVTLQFYKSTDNGMINEKIMKQIAKQLKLSQKSSNFVSSLVTQDNSQRPTEWVKSNDGDREDGNDGNREQSPGLLDAAWKYVQESSLYQKLVN